MLDIINYLLSKFTVFIAFLNGLVIVNFNGVNITLLGFIGGLLVMGIAIKLFMPKTH